jgi:ADP-heptose:LPS heptosyltransferase
MNISFMRTVDRWVGIPLCLLLSATRALTRGFRKFAPADPPRRILFMEISEMGSMVLAYPLFNKTRALFPEAELFFLTFQQNRHAIDMLSIFPEKNIYTLDNEKPLQFFSSVLSVLRKLRRKKLDLVIDMELFARFTAVLGYLTGALSRVGYFRFHNEGLYRGNLQTHKVQYNPHMHMAFNLQNLIYAITRPSDEEPLCKVPHEDMGLNIPEYTTPEKDEQMVLDKIQEALSNNPPPEKIILLNPNASDMIPLRRWPLDNYIFLAQRLLKNQKYVVLITGTQVEYDQAEHMRQQVNSPRCINFAGRTSFKELLALYTVSDVLVTNDSGPVHFSSMTGIRSVALFGPETPALYGPLGRNCKVLYAGYTCSPCVSAFNHRKSPCSDNRCLQAITVDAVYQAVLDQLDLKAKASIQGT